MTRFLLKYYPYFLSFIIPLFILLFVYALRNFYPFGEKSVLILDLYHQYIFYYEAFRDIFYEGHSFFYAFSRSLGGEMMGLYAYYLASPFTFLLLMFPKKLITEGILFMILVKVGASGLSFFIYLKNARGSSDFFALIFSIMYALMSYVVVHTMNPMFLDGVIFFPLVILGLERLVNESKCGIFILFLSLLFVTNFYIGYMVGFFVFFYFLYYLLSKSNIIDLKTYLTKFKIFLFSSLLSVTLSMWILLPTYFSLKMGKIGFTSPNFIPKEQLDIFDIFFKMLPFSYDTVNFDGLPFIFAGTMVLILFFGYFLSKSIPFRVKIFSALFVALIFFAFSISTVDIMLHGFQAPNWLNYRYSFVLTFFLLVLSYEFLVVINKENRGVLIKAFAIPMLIIALLGRFDIPYLKTEINIWFGYLLMFVYLIFLYYIQKFPSRKIFLFLLILFVSLEMFFNAFLLIGAMDEELYYSNRSSYRNYLEDFSPKVEAIKKIDQGLYRVEKTTCFTRNDPMVLGFYGISHSSSILNQSVLDLLFKLGYFSTSNWTEYKGGTVLTDSLLGIKYVIGDDLRHNLYKNVDLGAGMTYQNPYAMPFAFLIDGAYKEVRLNSLDPFINQNILLSSMLGEPYTEFFKPLEIQDIYFQNLESESTVEDFISYNYEIDLSIETFIDYVLLGEGGNPMYMYIRSTYPRDANLIKNGVFLETYSVASGDRFYIVPLGTFGKSYDFSLRVQPLDTGFYINDHMFYYLDVELFESAITKLKQSDIEIKKMKDTYLMINLESKKGELLFTSIPFDKGWRAFVNGKRVETLKGVDSLLTLELPEGENEVILKFVPYGFVPGLIISCFSVFLLIFLYLKKKNRVRKTKCAF